ncbi:MAG TPA: phage baseplate assembly protein V, partial [Candidatus Binataceae bacterium]|nr:phage baseplate assembly protein V [Candidatus Binataceae bacterium]
MVFAEFDQMLSYWLPVVVPKTQNDKAYWLPDVGEQVVCLMDDRDEAGVVLGAIYSKVDSTPVQSADKYHLGFKDGTSMEYDRAAHVLALSFTDGTAIKYDAGAHALALSFEDAASINYDASAHTLKLTFSDATTIQYDATAHALTMTSGVASASIVAPLGIVLTAGGSSVSILPGGVSVVPPLPL